MEICCWPEDDTFFSLGINEIVRKMLNENSETIVNVLFVNISSETFGKILMTDIDEDSSEMKKIFIYEERFTALANYYRNVNTSAIATFPLGDCVNKLSDFILKFPVWEQSKNLEESLSKGEYNALKLYARGYSAHRHSKLMNISIKTVYTLRYNAIYRLGMNRLTDVFLNKTFFC